MHAGEAPDSRSIRVGGLVENGSLARKPGSMEVTFILQDKTSHTVEAEPGWKLMEVAVDNAIPGIDGDCGGEAACATCHVYVAPEWRDATGEGDGPFVLRLRAPRDGETVIEDRVQGRVAVQNAEL